MDVVLDIDLDFFVWPAAYSPPWAARMPSDAVQWLASESDVRRFLESQCGLSHERRPLARCVRKHDDAFDTWKDWLAGGTLTAPFQVVHVDAHADLGLGDAGYIYLLTELLALPVAERSNPLRGPDGMGEGNYLAFALANRWISELVYVTPAEPPHLAAEREASMREWSRMMGWNDAVAQVMLAEDPDKCPAQDLMGVHFHRCDPRTGRLELKRYATRDDVVEAAGHRDCERRVMAHEPQVPFSVVSAPAFRVEGFTHLLVAHSPRYTPEAADPLLTVFREYGSFDQA